MDEKITFIIPTINRKSLTKTINSLKKQTNKNWECLLVFDGVEVQEFDDERIKYLKVPKLGVLDQRIGRSGIVRDFGLKVVKTEWIGFLDDDDTINPEYVSTLFAKYKNYDFVIFRMIYENGKILPKINSNDLKLNEVGISFAFKRKLFYNIFFDENVPGEDFYFLKKLLSRSKNYTITDEVFYYVRH